MGSIREKTQFRGREGGSIRTKLEFKGRTKVPGTKKNEFQGQKQGSIRHCRKKQFRRRKGIRLEKFPKKNLSSGDEQW